MEYILFLLSILAFADAQISTVRNNTGFYQSGPGNATIFLQANLSPNATGSVDVITFDHVSNWTLDLHVTDVADLGETGVQPTDVITNSVISIDTHGTWHDSSDFRTSVVLFLWSDRAKTVAGQKDTGNCYATLGEKCVREYAGQIMSKMGSYAQWVRQGKNTSAVPSIGSPPDICDFSTSGTLLDYDLGENGTLIDKAPYYYSASPVHDPLNDAFYREATTKVWSIFIMQTGKDGSPEAQSSIGGWRCLRSNATSDGSEKIKGVPSSGVRDQEMVRPALTIAFVIAVFIVMM